MPLNLSAFDGDFTPFLKFNAKAGRFYVRADGATEETEILNPVMAFDMAHIKTGWLYYAEGTGPEKVWDPSPTQMAPKPDGPRKFKRGFEVMTFSHNIIPRTTQKIGLREFSSTAGNVIVAIVEMYSHYEAGLKANPGCIPVFSCEGVTPITGAYGVNYEPQFVLKSWVPRSRVPAFDEQINAGPAQQQRPAGGNGSTHDEANPDWKAPWDDLPVKKEPSINKIATKIEDTF